MARVLWDRSKGRPEPIAALNRVLERENGEPLVEITHVAPKLKMARDSVIPFVRETVAEMVRLATESLPKGYFIGLIEGWRPIERQQRIYDFIWKSAVEAFPDRDHAALRRTVCRWVAPTDQKAPPGHCTGAAVDVLLLDASGEPLDVVSPYDRHLAARTYTLGLSETAQYHRDLLVGAMLGAGFSNCRDEYWHYSFGDAGWAVRFGLKECRYGLVGLDPAIYAEDEARHAEAMKTRESPFKPSNPKG